MVHQAGGDRLLGATAARPPAHPHAHNSLRPTTTTTMHLTTHTPP